MVKKARHYDTDKFDSFLENGQVVFNRLISDCRKFTIRFIYIPDSKIPGLIDETIGDDLDHDGEEYQVIFNKVRNWRKNWFNRFIGPAEDIMKDLKAKYGWVKISHDQLKALYQSKCCYEYIYQCMRGFDGGTIDWRDSLKHTWIHNLYRTIFTFTVEYVLHL